MPSQAIATIFDRILSGRTVAEPASMTSSSPSSVTRVKQPATKLLAEGLDVSDQVRVKLVPR